MKSRPMLYVLLCILLMSLLAPVVSASSVNSTNSETETSEPHEDPQNPSDLPSAVQVLPSGITYDEIGSNLEAFVGSHANTTAGLAVSVFDDEGVIYENYFGHQDIENELPVTQDTVFEWGSVTKIMVWTALMQLSEQELVDLDADIKTYLPENFLDLRYDTPITFLNLMNHETGFQDFIVELFVSRDHELLWLKDAVKHYMPPQIFEPGYTHGYSNWSTALGALIVEEVTGQRLPITSRIMFSNLCRCRTPLSI